MANDPMAWVLSVLADEGLTPLPPKEARGFAATGFIVDASPEPDAARVTVTARYTGQDKYDHWGEAHRLAYRVVGVLEKRGAEFEEIDSREPNCVYDVYVPGGCTSAE